MIESAKERIAKFLGPFKEPVVCHVFARVVPDSFATTALLPRANVGRIDRHCSFQRLYSIRNHTAEIAAAVNAITPNSYAFIEIPFHPNGCTSAWMSDAAASPVESLRRLDNHHAGAERRHQCAHLARRAVLTYFEAKYSTSKSISD